MEQLSYYAIKSPFLFARSVGMLRYNEEKIIYLFSIGSNAEMV